jgi:hypothetical protein
LRENRSRVIYPALRTILFAATAALGLAWTHFVGGPMDGTRWDVKIKSESLFSFAHRDTLVFEKGRVSVVGGAPQPFEAAVYSAETLDLAGEQRVWNASLGDEQRGVMTWHGMVRGDTIEGVAVLWPREGGKPKRFTFKGTKRA